MPVISRAALHKESGGAVDEVPDRAVRGALMVLGEGIENVVERPAGLVHGEPMLPTPHRRRGQGCRWRSGTPAGRRNAAAFGTRSNDRGDTAPSHPSTP